MVSGFFISGFMVPELHIREFSKVFIERGDSITLSSRLGGKKAIDDIQVVLLVAVQGIKCDLTFFATYTRLDHELSQALGNPITR